MAIDIVAQAEYIIREVKAQFKKPAVLWSTGKDSTVCLHLIKSALREIPWPAVFIDTGRQPDIMFEFGEMMAHKWDFDFVRISNKKAKDTPETSTFDCCNQRKTKALRDFITKDKYDAVITSIRWDEEAIRAKERFMSPRDKDFKWAYSRPGGPEGVESLQDAELGGFYFSDFGKVNHVRVHPLLNWAEAEIWEYTEKNDIPVNPLYYDGYRSLGCSPCSVPTMTPSVNVKGIISKIKGRKFGEERDGRAQDKENVMEKLRSIGYL